jgi:hypothetical protein
MVFAASSIQKSNFSSMPDELFPSAESTMITFFAKQFRWLRIDAGIAQIVVATKSREHP